MATIIALNNPLETVANLFCFHWVAGNGNAFKIFAKSVEVNGIKVFGVTLPGRNGRNTDQIPSSMQKLTISLFDLFVAQKNSLKLEGLPLIFIGHSLGGIVAFELAKKIKFSPSSNIVLHKLIVSAIKDPESLSFDNSDGLIIERHTQNSEALKEYIIKIGGLPAGVDPVFLDFALPTIRADYKLFETYDSNDVIYNEENKLFGDKLSCPLVTIVATDDYSVKEDMMLNWKNQTEGSSSTIYLPGSHFYLIEESHKIGFENTIRQEILSTVRELNNANIM